MIDFVPDNYLHKDPMISIATNTTAQGCNNTASNKRVNYHNKARQQYRQTYINNNNAYRNNNQIRNIYPTQRNIDISQFDRLTEEYNFQSLTNNPRLSEENRNKLKFVLIRQS